MNEILLNGIKVNELLDKIGQLIDARIKTIQKPETQNPSRFVSRSEVASLLKISLPTLNEWTKLGWLLSYKLGNRVLYKQDEVEQAVSKVTTLKYQKGLSHA